MVGSPWAFLGESEQAISRTTVVLRSGIGAVNSRGPAGLGGGSANLYAYAGDDPVNFSDPMGREYGFPIGGSYGFYNGVFCNNAGGGFTNGGGGVGVIGAFTGDFVSPVFRADLVGPNFGAGGFGPRGMQLARFLAPIPNLPDPNDPNDTPWQNMGTRELGLYTMTLAMGVSVIGFGIGVLFNILLFIFTLVCLGVSRDSERFDACAVITLPTLRVRCVCSGGRSSGRRCRRCLSPGRTGCGCRRSC